MKAHELIDRPGKWYPRNPNGHCAHTALMTAYGYDETLLREKIRILKSGIGRRETISQWNDSSNWETVYSMLKEKDL